LKAKVVHFFGHGCMLRSDTKTSRMPDQSSPASFTAASPVVLLAKKWSVRPRVEVF